MLDRPRATRLTWAAACALIFGVLAWAVVFDDRSPLDAVDRLGMRAEDWSDDRATSRRFLLLVEDAFNTIGMTVLTVLAALGLLVRGQRRAAGLLVGVMLTTAGLTSLFKTLLSRKRPDWQETIGLNDTMSFPSGHASSVAAFAGVLVVLAFVFWRRASMRRTALVVLGSLWLLVCLDRVLLGRHYPTDVLAGSLLAAAVVLAWLAVIDPRPRSIALGVEPLPEVYVSQRRLAVVLNPVKVEDVGQFRSIVAAMAAEAGWSEPTWHDTTVEDPGAGMAERAAVEGADLVLVCGGDGTVREVCAELAGTGIPVGIIPAGTGNLLARNLGIPLYLRSAIDVALHGQDRAIDLVDVSGDGIEDTHFLVMAGMGFDAAIMEGVNEDIKRRIGWVAYVLSGMRSLMFPAVKIEIQIDDQEPTVHRARTVVVGNVGFLQAGMPLLPDATLDDGILDVVIIHPRQFLSWVTVALRVLRKSSVVDETLDRRTGRQVVLRTSTDTPRQLDGDSIGPGKELRMTCVHGRLLVRVPR